MGLGFAVIVGIVSILTGAYYYGSQRIHAPQRNPSHGRWDCRPFLPNLFANTPPSSTLPAILDGVAALERYFDSRFAVGDIDSLSVAVVTADGPIYERNFGVTRGNETDSPPTTSHSTYRIASTGKLFPVLEGLILEQKGIISWYVALHLFASDMMPV